MPTSKGIPGLPANSSPFSPPSAAPPSEEELGWGPAGVGLRQPVPGPRNSSGSGNCTSSGGGRPGPGPAGWEPQERERAEEGEEEGKEKEEERSSQQARGGRTSGRGGCQQPRKRKTERSGERPSGATREETWESHSPRRPPRRLHLQDRGLSRPLPYRSADPWGFGGCAWAPPGLRQGGGGSFFSGQQTFRGDALRGEVRPPKRTGQPLIAACAPELLGPGGPGEGTTQHLRRLGPPAQLGGRGREVGLWVGRGAGAAGQGLPQGWRSWGAGGLGGPAQASRRPGRAEERLHSCSPRPWSPCSWDDLGPVSLNSSEKCPTLGLGRLFLLSAPARICPPCSGLCHFCLFVSGGFPFLPPFRSPERKPQRWPAHCFLTHSLSVSLCLSPSLSLSSLQTQLWSSAVAATAAGKTCPCPPSSRRLPYPVLPSPTRHP